MSLRAPRNPQAIDLNASPSDPSLDFSDELGCQQVMVRVWPVDSLGAFCCVAMVRASFLLSSLGLCTLSSSCHLGLAQIGHLLLPHLSPRVGSIFWVTESPIFLLVRATGACLSLNVRERHMWVTVNL